ncbi:MAG TPA: hypothetical protein DCL48_12380, partial [Alphaproteobacteria bacterium]|nr:hypothetical protein [Alphaproteobacteria bacterium]
MTDLHCQGLTVKRGGRLLVDDMSFGATPGEVIGVLGPNGAGKSTMLRALAGLIPFQGSVALGGRQMTAMTLREQARALSPPD